jgi:uncharacterized cupredoxin-like copper-binding protein
MRRLVIAVVICLGVAGTAVAGFSFAGVVGPKTAQKVAVTDVNVSAIEYNFVFKDTAGNTVTSAPAGVINFHVTNNGTIEHDFQIAGQKTPTLFPGQTATLTVTLNGGAYNYVCTIGEHASFGMFGQFNVTGQVQTTTQVITTNGTTITTTATQTQPTTVPTPVATLKVSEKEFKIILPSVKKRVAYYKRVKGKRVKAYKYILVQKSVKHGLVKFVVKNVGKIAHNFVISTGQTSILKTGQTGTISVNLKKGKYKYVCSITGHAAAGMKGTLVVT